MTEREKGAYFEELTRVYLRNEATYRDLYSDVWTYADWAKAQGFDARDVGIDLVAKTHGTDEFHAIQCKLRYLATNNAARSMPRSCAQPSCLPMTASYGSFNAGRIQRSDDDVGFDAKRTFAK